MAIGGPKKSVDMRTVIVEADPDGVTWNVTITGVIRFYGDKQPISAVKNGATPGTESVINGVITELNDAGDAWVVAHGG